MSKRFEVVNEDGRDNKAIYDNHLKMKVDWNVICHVLSGVVEVRDARKKLERTLKTELK